MPQTAEAIIIGAGVMGASLAFHLTRAGMHNVLVVDNNGDVWDSLSKDYAPRQEPDKSTHYTKITEVPLPPLSSAVELNDENEQLPAWLTASRAPQAGQYTCATSTIAPLPPWPSTPAGATLIGTA